MLGSSPGSISQVKDCLKKKRSIAGKTGFKPLSVAIMFYFASMARRTSTG